LKGRAGRARRWEVYVRVEDGVVVVGVPVSRCEEGVGFEADGGGEGSVILRVRLLDGVDSFVVFGGFIVADEPAISQ